MQGQAGGTRQMRVSLLLLGAWPWAPMDRPSLGCFSGRTEPHPTVRCRESWGR